MEAIKINSENVDYWEDFIESRYKYATSQVTTEQGKWIVTPNETNYVFRTQRKV